MKEYDEDEAVKYMKDALSGDEANLYDDDEILNLIDIIWDFYNMNGLLDIDNEDDDEDDESLIDEIVDYARRTLQKDKHSKLNPDHLSQLISAEIEYENSLIDF